MHQYQRVLEDIKGAIDQNQLAHGSQLPSERQSAHYYAVSRSTVRRAWRELESMGYITWADQETPMVIGPPQWPVHVDRSRVGRLAHELRPSFLGDLMQAAVSSARYNFEVGMPDPDLLPVQDFQQILRELFAYPSRDVFGYSPTMGLERVRQSIRDVYLVRRGLQPRLDQILVTAGSLQGLNLLTRLWVQPGDVVVVESPTFAGALHIFRAYGATIVGVPVDQHGMRTDLLPEILKNKPRPRFLYVQPVGQNPTGVTLSAQRREMLCAWANASGVPIVEDDAYGFLSDHLPLAAQNPDVPLVYLNTFSKILSPGIRVGCVVAPADLIRQLVSLKQLSDLHTGTLSQLVVEGWLRLGNVDTHIARARSVYGARLKTAEKTIAKLSRFTLYARPAHGFYLFVRLPAGIKAATVQKEAVKQEVLFAVGDPFGFDQDFSQWMRLAVGAQPIPQIETGLRRLARLVDDSYVGGSTGSS